MDRLFFLLNTVAYDYELLVVSVDMYTNDVDVNCSDVVFDKLVEENLNVVWDLFFVVFIIIIIY